MSYRKEDYIYVGINLHKETHTAVISDCWNTKLGEITFANTPAEFPKLVRKVKKYCIENKQAVYGYGLYFDYDSRNKHHNSGQDTCRNRRH